ncbi:LOW QUALITY PROTEIN: hypothetical protein Cgig2_030093 [Carnegiea gigantea]|uniref:DUF4283 domain-containing protein n=1 Tax=Carnegiea gigantea TaxID=171969 RepID=A0A9Q1GQE9_9CARY|nr:LOW QUALITY PROTEIN: hypothetical protein Cgig2_030093 [Carnegiea gigantea]
MEESNRIVFKQIEHQPTVQPDPDKGIELKSVPTEVINETKVAKNGMVDVENKIKYWQHAVLYSMLGANPPYEVMQGFIKRIWPAYEIDYSSLKRSILNQDKIAVEEKGVYFFDAKPFLVKGWNPKMDLKTKEIKSFPIWIQLLDLDFKFWHSESLSKIGSILGISLMTDKYTRDKLLIDISPDGQFPDYIEFFNEHETLQVVYEWKPLKCLHCKIFGHEESHYKKKLSSRQEWRQNIQHQENTDEQLEFSPVSRRVAAKQSEGNEVHKSDVRDFAEFLKKGKLFEMRWTGSYYSWTNKTIWSSIDRVIINSPWYRCFDFTQNHILPIAFLIMLQWW